MIGTMIIHDINSNAFLEDLPSEVIGRSIKDETHNVTSALDKGYHPSESFALSCTHLRILFYNLTHASLWKSKGMS